jgi:hypothetical protein
MIRFLFNLALARLVEHILWGEAIKQQTLANKAATQGKSFTMIGKKLHLGYPFKIRAWGGSIVDCYFIGEQDWRKKFAPNATSTALHFPDTTQD